MKLSVLLCLAIISTYFSFEIFRSTLAPAYVFQENKQAYGVAFIKCEKSKYAANFHEESMHKLPERTAFNLRKTIKIEMISCFERDLLRSILRANNVKTATISHYEKSVIAEKATRVSQLFSELRS